MNLVRVRDTKLVVDIRVPAGEISDDQVRIGDGLNYLARDVSSFTVVVRPLNSEVRT